MVKSRFTHIKQHKASSYRGVYKTKDGWTTLIIIDGERQQYGPFLQKKRLQIAMMKRH